MFLICLSICLVITLSKKKIMFYRYTKKYLFKMLIISLLSSCDNAMSVKNYGSYLNDTKNGFCQEVSRNELTWRATYQPLDYVIALQTHDIEVSKHRDKYVGMQYFTFEVLGNEATEGGRLGLKRLIEKRLGEKEYDNSMNYYRFGMQSNMKLLIGKDTASCLMYHLEQTGYVANRLKILLGFEDAKKMIKPNISEDLKLICYDKLLNQDTLTFIFSKNILNQSLNIKK